MKIVTMAVCGLLMFAVAMAGSWYVKANVLAPKEESVAAAAVDLTADPLAANEQAATDSDGTEIMPNAVRPEAMSVEELLRFSLSLKEREKVLKEQEEQFQQRQVQQQLGLVDIQAEEETVNGLRAEVAAELTTAQNLIDQLNQLKTAIVGEREKTKQDFSEIESKQIEISDNQKANDKKMSLLLQGMSAENAAAALTEMANNGDIRHAVQLLSYFEEREAAKVLDALQDPKLLNEFIAEFRNLKSETGRKLAGARRTRAD